MCPNVRNGKDRRIKRAGSEDEEIKTKERLIYSGVFKWFANQFAMACPRGDKYQADINASLYGRTLMRGTRGSALNEYRRDVQSDGEREERGEGGGG